MPHPGSRRYCLPVLTFIALILAEPIAGVHAATVNQAPVIISPAWTVPNPVTLPAIASLGVMAADDSLPNPPAALTYTWSVVSGAGAVTFLPNGTTASANSTATFSAAGVYVLRVTVSDSALSVTSDVTVNVLAAPLPAPWQHQDIGAVGIAGDASYANGVFTVKGGGADIWNNADAFHFVYQPLNGDGTIVARVTSIQNTDPWAKAGVMIRETLNANSTFAMMIFSGNGLSFQNRPTTGGACSYTGPVPAPAPAWVKLVRSGNTFNAFSSFDGVNWTNAGAATINMAANVYIGLAVTAHNNNALNTSTLDNVTAIVGAAPPPNQPPTVALTSPANNATFTAPANIIITANAADSDGTVAKVDFYNGATLLGTATASPYSFTWSNVAAGTYSLTAMATDNSGSATTSSAVNITVNAPPPSGTLPPPWQHQDIGTVGLAGDATYASGIFTVKGGGGDIWNNADAFHFVYQPLNGDGSIVARVTSVQNTDPWAKAGVMIRETLNANATYVDMVASSGSGLALQYRQTTGGNCNWNGVGGSVPAWVKLARSGSTFNAYRSTDGINWSSLGSTTVNMAASVYIGLAVTAHNNNALNTSTLDNVTATVGAAPPPNQPPTVALTNPANNAAFTAPANITITANASDSDGTIAKVEFYYNNTTLLGTSTASPYSFTWNSVAAGSYSLTAKATDNSGASTTSAGVNVTVNTAPPPPPPPPPSGSLPAPWQHQDIGAVGIAGDASYANGVFTVKGGGADIWNNADAFHFLYQPLNGDGSIVARVTSVQNTDPWAKAGVMIRETLNANATYVDMVASSGSGLALQYRQTTGGNCNWNGVGGSVPAWVKLARSGSTFNAYRSTDGINWSSLGSTTVNMAASVYIGLAVTAHNNNALNTSTLDNVTATVGAAPPPNQPPTVALTSPANNATYTAPANITITATASDSDGSVAKVDFYNGATLLETATACPYSFTWNGIAAGTYTLTAKATDNSGASTTSPAVNITVNAAPPSSPPSGGGTGKILREWWTGISGNAVSDLTSNPNYPDGPSGSDYPTSFEAPSNWASDYGTRMRGYIYPPATGSYTFWIASDDNGELWLSTDNNPANKTKIATVSSWTPSRAWDTYAEQKSVAINLVAGQAYYIEALQKQGGGGDNLAVAWQGPGLARDVIVGQYLSPFPVTSSLPQDPAYDQRYRPQFHFTSLTNWLNDPNGCVFYNGEYHLFFQHDPISLQWGDMTWGHAVSTDMLHWQQLADAISPYDGGEIWSGSAVVDANNLSGFKQGAESPLVAAFTHAKQPYGQALAYSNDKGRTWQLYANGAAVVPNQGMNNEERDPKIFWHAASQKWVMVLWVGGVRFFNSSDLKQWNFASDFPCSAYECPDLYQLPVDGNTQNMKWVLQDAGFNYWIGSFDGTKFVPEAGPFQGDLGSNFYAAQTWNNTGSRVMQIAWMRGGVYPNMPFNQQMSFPCDLSLRTTAQGIRLCRLPIAEIQNLYVTNDSVSNRTLNSGDGLSVGGGGIFST